MIIIGKNKFDVPQPRGMSSFGLQQRVLPVAARIVEVLAYLITGMGGDSKKLLGDDGKPDLAKLMGGDVLSVLPAALPAIGRVFSEMPDGELEKVTRSLLIESTCDGVPLFVTGGDDPFDKLMAGRTMDTWRLLWHAIGVWYPDFFALARKSSGTSGPAKSSAA